MTNQSSNINQLIVLARQFLICYLCCYYCFCCCRCQTIGLTQQASGAGGPEDDAYHLDISKFSNLARADLRPPGTTLNMPNEVEKFQTNIDHNDIERLATGTCQLVPIVHLVKHPKCQLKAISSFACSGACSSYVQTQTKSWPNERSCSCCQETGSKEATFTLDCPSLDPPYRKIKTFAPTDCMCRSCTSLAREQLRPQELVEALAGDVEAATKLAS